MIYVHPSLEILADAIEKERGPLDLLALFQREGAIGWELVFAAPWVGNSIWDAIGYVNERAGQLLSKEDASEIKSLVPLTTAAGVLATMFPGPGEYHHFTLHEVPVARAIIVRLRPAAANSLAHAYQP
ncbi:MAG TPA: hypothetical protein VFC78_07415 [Tepidisphaeraceae bacterium]|nr:hypothetical protein [Tepidisphaeraceae bacterium]